MAFYSQRHNIKEIKALLLHRSGDVSFNFKAKLIKFAYFRSF